MFIVLEKFLKLNNFSSVISDFRDYYQSHPNYPSLFALTDTLSLLNIENVAARVEEEHFDDLPDCFLCYIVEEKKGPKLALVRKSNGAVQIMSEGEKWQQLSTEDFKDRWNGIVVAIESSTDDVTQKVLPKTVWWLGFVVACLGGFVLLHSSELTWSNLTNFLLYLLGASLSISIVREKLIAAPGEVSKICSFGSNTSCDSVIKSDQAEFTQWIGFSDLGIIFFGGALLALMMNPETSALLNSLCLLALPILAYSIWIQFKVLKTWCVLCLGLSAVLIAQSIWAVFFGVTFQFGWIEVAFALSLALIVWLFVRGHLKRSTQLNSENRDLLRFKRDFEIFQFLQQSKTVNTSKIDEGKVTLGSITNPVKLSLVISPSCPHCDTAFADALTLYKENPKRVQLEFFYNLNPNNRDNPYLNIARTVLRLSIAQPEKCIEALSEWHLSKKKEPEEWLNKWGVHETDINLDQWMTDQYNWCLQNEFNYTPVKIVNDSELSNHYSITELAYFLSELSESEEDSF